MTKDILTEVWNLVDKGIGWLTNLFDNILKTKTRPNLRTNTFAPIIRKKYF